MPGLSFPTPYLAMSLARPTLHRQSLPQGTHNNTQQCSRNFRSPHRTVNITQTFSAPTSGAQSSLTEPLCDANAGRTCSLRVDERIPELVMAQHCQARNSWSAQGEGNSQPLITAQCLRFVQCADKKGTS